MSGSRVHREPRCGGRTASSLLTALLVAVPVGAVDARLADTFAAAGLQPLETTVPAADFRLPWLAGEGEGALSDSAGRWIVLTFWAAWCAPCRSEMPSLESLHRQRSDSGVAVLGVALDARAEAARSLARQLDVSFPSFHDASGKVAALYRAESIPMTYLIDPRGAVVAFARGARDWAALVPVLDAALAAVPPGAGETVFAEAARLELASISEPPSAEVWLEETGPRPGRSFHLLVRLRWAGDFTEYLPHPPVVHLPEGVVREGVTAESSSEDGRHLVSYRIALRAAEAGSYALDPVELRYTPRGESEPLAVRVAGPTATVSSAGLGLGRVGVGASSVTVLALVLLFVVRWRRRGRPDPEAPEDDHAWLRERFAAARAARIKGDTAAFLADLAEIERHLGAVGEQDAAELSAWIEAARYGGQAPPAFEMDKLQRRVERRLESCRPDPREVRRRLLRLRRIGAEVEEGSR